MRKSLFLIYFLCFYALHAEIKSISTLSPLQEELLKSPKNTLLLLDIGGTLLAYPDAILCPENETWKYQWFQTHYPQMKSEEKIALDEIILTTLGQWQLQENEWPEVLEQANALGISPVAFTKVPRNSLQSAQILQTHGLQLKEDLPLTSGQTYQWGHGIIATQCSLKGPVLKEVLSNLNFRPEKIIFVDDRLKQVQSVHDVCSKLNICCTALHYTSSSPTLPLNEKTADYQLMTLVQDHRWVHDDVTRQKRLE